MSNVCTFAIISHPDAGKTTLTEQLLFNSGAIQLAGVVKGRGARRQATSDWLALEKERGISVSTSVLSFNHGGRAFNLLDTPGHEDFSEDTYRTLTAVDGALIVIDAAKGVEPRTLKLMEICRLRKTPVITFVNKCDRDSLPALKLVNDLEKDLNIQLVPQNWPLGSGKEFQGLLDLNQELFFPAQKQAPISWTEFVWPQSIEGLKAAYLEECQLWQSMGTVLSLKSFQEGQSSPLYFGSALRNVGIKNLLDSLAEFGPRPQQRAAKERLVLPEEPKFSGFVFKIQANMDPAHRDRMAFVRIVSGEFKKGMKLFHVRTGKTLPAQNALTFFADQRQQTDIARAGDVIGIPNHGTIHLGDSFTSGEILHFTGIPNFVPELFKRVHLLEPMKNKSLVKGLQELAEEGSIQIFRPYVGNHWILGAIGNLQFEVTMHRLLHEYRVSCHYESVAIEVARWVDSPEPLEWQKFQQAISGQLAQDSRGNWVYLAPNRINLKLTQERWPKISFTETKERH